MRLDEIKEEFKLLAKTDYHIDEEYTFIVHHPFADSSVIFVDGQLRRIDEPGVWKKYLRDLERRIDRCQNVTELFVLVMKPYLPTVFKFVYNYMNETDYNQILRSVYTLCEYPNHDTNVSYKDWAKYFKKSNKEIIMSQSELEKLDALDDIVTIYRGVSNDHKYYNAFSWTLDKERANWYATRFDKDGVIYSLDVPKKEIIAYFEDDDEIIFNPKKYKEQIKIEKIKGRVI